MRFKLDENLPASLRELLQKYHHQAVTVIDEGLGGSGDRELFAACQDEKLVIVTLDTDFASLKAYPPGDHQGIMVMRLRRQSTGQILSAFERFLLSIETLGDLSGCTVIIEEHRVRVRRPD
jgi:predicted nuclease of predicted toxin-antitoxin system